MSNQPVEQSVNVAPQTTPVTETVQNAIPYQRFKEVVDQKNQLADQLSQLSQSQQQAYQQQNAGPQTVDDLMNVVNSQVEKKLQDAYNTRVAPLEKTIQDQAFTSQLANYFSSPDKAQLFDDINAYTAGMSPGEQQFLRNEIVKGNTRWLDTIYHTVRVSKQSQVQNSANQVAMQSANYAQSPTQYKQVVMPSLSKEERIANAKKTGDWSQFFANLVPPPQ